MSAEPNIFEYTEYRNFLKDRYHWLKSQSGKYSFRFLAREAGYKSPNFLKLVIEGDRNLAPDQALAVGHAFKLVEPETSFFILLVNFSNARSSSEKSHWVEQMLKHRGFSKMFPLVKRHSGYFKKWHLVAIRELVGVPGFVEDPEWIGKRLVPEVSKSQVVEGLNDLLQMGLLIRDSSGKLQVASGNVTAGPELMAIFAADYHRMMLGLASESIERFSSSDRELSSVCVKLSTECLEVFKQKVAQFQNEILELERLSTAGSTQSVYQIGIQAFPMTKIVMSPGRKESV